MIVKYVLATLVSIGFVLIAVVVMVANALPKFDAETAPSKPVRKSSDHPIPHDSSEEDMADPVAAALAWKPEPVGGPYPWA